MNPLLTLDTTLWSPRRIDVVQLTLPLIDSYPYGGHPYENMDCPQTH